MKHWRQKTKWLVTKQGVQIGTVYAQMHGGAIFWKASPRQATEFNLTKARQLARREGGTIHPTGSGLWL